MKDREQLITHFEFEDYKVSNKGYVWSKKTNKKLKEQDNGNGYKKVSLRKDGKTYQKYIHRLVAEVFLKKNSPYLTEVDHINQDKSDNSTSNLRWVSRSTNSKNYSRNNRRGYKLNRLTQEDKSRILFLDSLNMSTVEIGRVMKIPRQTVYSFLKTRRIYEN